MVNTRSASREKTALEKGVTKRLQSLNARLKRFYYNVRDPAGFASVKKLQNKVLPSERAQVLPWLQSQDVYTTHRPRRRNFPVNFLLATQADHCWELDLAVLDKHADENDGFKYLLFVVDMFDKYLWVEPMTDKTAEECLRAFKAVLQRAGGRKPKFIRSDSGGEFLNKLFTSYLKRVGIQWQLAGNWSKAGLVEVTIKTVKAKLWKIFYWQGSFRYVDVLQDVVSAYNHSRHSRTGLAPADVGQDDAFHIWSRHYKRHVSGPPPPPKYRVGDYVRVLIKRKGVLQDRGYKQGYSDEIFKIYRVQTKHQTGYLAQPLYHLADLAGENILGGWVEHELTPTTYDVKKDTFRIDEILDSRINKSSRRKELLVTFWGYPKSFKEWIEARGVQTLARKKK